MKQNSTLLTVSNTHLYAQDKIASTKLVAGTKVPKTLSNDDLLTPLIDVYSKSHIQQMQAMNAILLQVTSIARLIQKQFNIQ